MKYSDYMKQIKAIRDKKKSKKGTGSHSEFQKAKKEWERNSHKKEGGL